MSSFVYLCWIFLTGTNLYVSGLQKLNTNEMKSLIPLEGFERLSGYSHQCDYLSIPSDSYTSGSKNIQYAIECCGRRTFNICGRQRSTFVKHCCPGFVKFVDIDGSESNCNERILADRTMNKTLSEFKSDSVKIQAFTRSVVQSDRVQRVLRTDAQASWTIFAVSDEGFETTMVDFTNEVLKHVVRGRRYISDLKSGETLKSMYQHESGTFYPLKFSRYSNGISCIECSPLLETGYESANGVVHVLHKGILSKKQPKSLGSYIQEKYSTFWQLLDKESRSLLNDESCSALYSVYIPKNLDSIRAQSDSKKKEALQHHIIKGLWCTAATIEAETGPIATLASGSIKFACNARSDRTLLSGDMFSTASIISKVKGEFDIMATNGVIHEIDNPLRLTRIETLQVAFQMHEVETETSETDPVAFTLLLEACGIEFQESVGYIALLPTKKALESFTTSKLFKDVPESTEFWMNKEVRCRVLKHHILISNTTETDLGRATHFQKTYKTLNEDYLTDYLMHKNGNLQVFFADAKVINADDSNQMTNGHVYEIDKVIIPPSSLVWRRLRDSTLSYTSQQYLSRAMEIIHNEWQSGYTIFVPNFPTSRTIHDTDTIRSFIVKNVFYPQYIETDGESIDLATLHQDVKLTIRKEGTEHYVTPTHDAISDPRRIINCGIRLSSGRGLVCITEETVDKEFY